MNELTPWNAILINIALWLVLAIMAVGFWSVLAQIGNILGAIR